MVQHERIADQLRAEILTGVVAPGDPVSETRIAQRLGTSPTPVREAIWQLITEGYVEPASNGRRRVANLTHQRAVHLVDVLAILVPAAMDRAGMHARGIELDGLADQLDTMAVHFEREDAPAMIGAAVEHVTTLGQLSGMTELANLLGRTAARAGVLILYPEEVWTPWRAWAARSRWTATAIRARQARAASEAYREMLAAISERLADAARFDPPHSPAHSDQSSRSPSYAGTPGALYEVVAHQVRNAIASGDLRPGAPVRETELAQRFGCSSTPVREALSVLRTEGLIEGAANKARRVATVTDDQLDQLVVICGIIHDWLCDHVVPGMTRAEFDRFTAAARTIALGAPSDPGAGGTDAVLEAENALVAPSGNTELWRALRDVVQRTIPRWHGYPTSVRPLRESYERLAEIEFDQRGHALPTELRTNLDAWRALARQPSPRG